MKRIHTLAVLGTVCLSFAAFAADPPKKVAAKEAAPATAAKKPLFDRLGGKPAIDPAAAHQ